MFQLPLLSTLFPYTTLFRSIQDRHERDFCLGPTHEEVITDIARNELKSYRQLLSSLRDRKSTRLNSSHLGISYAVFCLKKKKSMQLMYVCLLGCFRRVTTST